LGRLIRSGQDRGALCILDARILTRGYGRAFLQSLPSCRVTTDRKDLRRFFEHGTAGEWDDEETAPHDLQGSA